MTANKLAVPPAISVATIEALMQKAHAERAEAMSNMLSAVPAFLRGLVAAPRQPLRQAGALTR